MIIGAHTIIYSEDAEADRAFFRDILDLNSVDAGHGRLIYGLPPAEAAFHPADRNGAHELYFMSNDLKAEMTSLSNKGVECVAVQDERWGLLTHVQLPGGGKIGIYQPKHPMALNLGSN